jgi:hypothetical protein
MARRSDVQYDLNLLWKLFGVAAAYEDDEVMQLAANSVTLLTEEAAEYDAELRARSACFFGRQDMLLLSYYLTRVCGGTCGRLARTQVWCTFAGHHVLSSLCVRAVTVIERCLPVRASSPARACASCFGSAPASASESARAASSRARA